MRLLVLSVFLAFTGASNVTKVQNQTSSRKSYVCPPDFIRSGNKCYFFSKSSAKWDDAFFNCNDMHSTLAVIRGKYQHRLLIKLLTVKNVAHSERWIGGRYDWGKHEWLWGVSGKTIDYNGFSTPPPQNISVGDSFKWHCIILDPKLRYSWNHKGCHEQKHYICQTKLRIVNQKQKMKLRKLYNNRKLNEVPVPEITSNAMPISNLNDINKLKANNESNDINNTAFASRPKPQRKRKGRNRKGKGRKKNKKSNKWNQNFNGTLQDAPQMDGVPSNMEQNHRKSNKTAPKKIHWKTYYQGTVSPYHPRGIVEEFDFQN